MHYQGNCVNFSRKMKGRKIGKYIECDGYISGSLTAPISNALSGLTFLGGRGNNKATEKWVPRKCFVLCEQVANLMYYEEPRLLTPTVSTTVSDLPRPTFLRPADRQMDDDRDIPLPNDNVEETDQAPQEYAPAGWYFSCGNSILGGDKEYHIARDQDAEALGNSSDSTPVANAILRLAEEIALNPGKLPGSAFLEAVERQQGNGVFSDKSSNQ